MNVLRATISKRVIRPPTESNRQRAALLPSPGGPLLGSYYIGLKESVFEYSSFYRTLV